MIEHIEVADDFITPKQTDLMRFFKSHADTHVDCKKTIWCDKTLSGSPGHMRRNIYRNLKWTFEDLLLCNCYTIMTRVEQSTIKFCNLPTQAKEQT